jgi:CheY-like chemotaxis protein
MARVVLAEDDPGARLLLTHILEEAGHRVTAAWNGVDALRVIRQSDPDVVVTDLAMPQMNGIDLCNHLRNDPKTMSIPIIVITGTDDQEAVQRKLPFVAATLRKPFKPSSVMQVMDVVLRSTQPLPEATASAIAGLNSYGHRVRATE